MLFGRVSQPYVCLTQQGEIYRAVKFDRKMIEGFVCTKRDCDVCGIPCSKCASHTRTPYVALDLAMVLVDVLPWCTCEEGTNKARGSGCFTRASWLPTYCTGFTEDEDFYIVERQIDVSETRGFSGDKTVSLELSFMPASKFEAIFRKCEESTFDCYRSDFKGYVVLENGTKVHNSHARNK